MHVISEQNGNFTDLVTCPYQNYKSDTSVQKNTKKAKGHIRKLSPLQLAQADLMLCPP